MLKLVKFINKSHFVLLIYTHNLKNKIMFENVDSHLLV